ncbi:hypothetical protein [Phytoactinopolyspora endophytica]|uniref:hypothetical protein n=1 Tax=Phytoactinopolyspora endophytica TaxID=1642495 RepID=UPI00101C6A46|nr:hypothetical protein [Phytoactinopolyspora endophytica]
MSGSLSNRDIYGTIVRIGEETSRPLLEYLQALWRLGRAERTRQALPSDLFVALLAQATSAPVPSFDDTWRTSDLSVDGATPGFDVWERVILSQIADLRDFAEGPEQSFPELGVDAPRRQTDGARANARRWYNHSLPAYLECAMAGALGGWDAGDGIRKALPGSAVQIYPEPQSVVDLPSLSWQDFTEFLICGQEYE